MPDEPPTPRQAAFELTDRAGRLAAVRLVHELGLAEPLDFTRVRGVWRLAVSLPDVHRLEYLFEISDHNGARTTIPDPTNPRRAPGAFGEKSVLELAGYAPPAWLALPSIEATTAVVDVDAPELDAAIELTVWAPADIGGAAAPLLIAHDGPEYDRLGGLTQYLGACIGAGALPPLRAVLLDPGDRNAWYSANAAYARTLSEEVLPAVADLAPATVRIGMGASLGALAMLHVHHTLTEGLDGLFLQSGSFFKPDLDPQESTFSGFAAVTSFVAALDAAQTDAHPVPVVLTCGTVEENLANNEAIAATLRRLGYPARLVQLRDAHNYTAWRDAFDPYLTELVAELVGAHAA